VRCSSACEDVSQGTEERPLLEDVTKQHSEDVTKNMSLCVIVI
jgi:hypothetical protein